MIKVHVAPKEYWDERNETFVLPKGISPNGVDLSLEHSLISLSKWESKWKKPFLDSEKSRDESVDYVRCMTLNKEVDPLVYKSIDNDTLKKIFDYINDSMTATTFRKELNNKSGGRAERITSELVYYWMVSYGIPFDCEKWHLNRLMTLIRICGIKNNPNGSKMSRQEQAAYRSALNASRRASAHSKG